MDYEQLEYDLQYAFSIRLLKADHAALIVSFLHRQFKREQRVSVTLDELVERLEDYLEALNERAPGSYGRTAQAYISEWADEQHRFIRIIAPVAGKNEKALVELTADTERAIGWLEEMHAQPFVSTESRFFLVVHMIRDMLQKSTDDPALRLAQLEQQRAEIQQQIEAIQETGKVDDRYSSTQLRERFLEAGAQARQLLRDFRLVEDRFRDIARSVQEAQLQPDARKGSLVEYVLDADAELKSSDQGRSFYTFWDFLMAPSQQEELYGLLSEVNRLPELQSVNRDGNVLRYLPAHLIEAGEKIVQSNYRLAEQLRRILDEQTQAESRRVRELALEIKQMAHRLAQQAAGEDLFLELEGPPQARLALERTLWEPAETTAFGTLPLDVEEEDLSQIDLTRLYNQFYVDEPRLRERITRLLAFQRRVTLADLLTHYPLEKGLSEALTYCAIAAKEPCHEIDASVTERVVCTIAQDEGNVERTLLLPRIVYQRSDHEN